MNSEHLAPNDFDFLEAATQTGACIPLAALLKWRTEVASKNDCTVYLRNASYSKTICELVSGDVSFEEIAELIVKRGLATTVDASFTVYVFNKEGQTIEAHISQTAS